MRNILSILVLLSFLPLANAEDNRILAKEDADMMFSMSLEEWNYNVQTAVESGVSKTFMEDEFLPTGLPIMSMVGDGLHLTVTPMYSGGSLAQIYIDSMNTKYKETDQSVIDSIFNSAKNEMQPEYEVKTFLINNEGSQIFRFVISKRGKQNE